MIKNIIFDLDNTIIKDQESDALFYKDALKKLGYDENDCIDISYSIDEYDKTKTENDEFYSKEKLLSFINNRMNRNYSIELIDEILDVMGKTWTANVILDEEILKQLSKKYDLYVYTNYFEEAQTERIKNIGYLKYFKRVFGADKFGCKQFQKSFKRVLETIGTTPDECIMIGDSKHTDILAANHVGMKSILFDQDGTRDKENIALNNYIVIKDMKELLEIL